jgi:DNA invertase Pin-like site-specific DNA recombinase
MSNKNCVILARISSAQQDRELSLPAQVSRLKDYANRRQMTILDERVLIESSTVGDRAKFLDCIKYCVKNNAALLIDTIDRAQRSFMEIPLLEKYRKTGQLEIHFARENIIVSDKSSSSDILMWHQGVLMAEAYSLHFKENVRRSVVAKIGKGEFPGAGPLGYKNIRTPDNRSDIILDDNADLVKQLFTKYATGQVSLSGLVNYAYEIGLRTARGGKLAKSHIHTMIRNPFYYGVAKWGQQTYEHKYPKLIPYQVWLKCNDILSGKNQHKSTRWGSIQYLYRGLITDYWSGRVVTTERKKNKYNYLMTWDENGKHVAVNEDTITGQIIQILERLQVSREMVDGVAEYLKSAKELEAEYNKRIMAEIARDITTTKNRKDALLNMYLDGKIDDTTYNAKNAELGTQLDELYGKQRINRAADDTVNDTIVKFFRATQNVADNFIKSSEVEAKRTIIKTIFRTIKLKGKTLCYYLNFPFNILENYTESQDWHPIVNDFRTIYAEDIRKLAANWNFDLPMAA